MKMTKPVAVVAGLALALPVAAVVPSASAGTAPPPCKNRAIKKAIKPVVGDVVVTVVSKHCKDYWASGDFSIEGEDPGSYLLEDNGGAWQWVSNKRRAKLCKPSNTTLPKKVKKYACVS